MDNPRTGAYRLKVRKRGQMEYPLSSVITITVVNGLIFLALIIIIFIINQRRGKIRIKTQSRLKSGLEQRLVLEAISACALREDFDDIVESLGKHAAAVAGYEEWAIWLETEHRSFVLKALEGDSISQYSNTIGTETGPEFTAWIRNNPYPIHLKKTLTSFEEQKEVKDLLSGFADGLLIPFVDGESVLGIILLGKRNTTTEHRSEQFLNLFGAISAVLLRRGLLEKKEKVLLKRIYQERYMARLGELAAGLAHEIRNPMTLLKSATQHFADHYKFEDQDEELKEVMLGEIKRINDLIEDLLLLGRIENKEFEVIDIAEVVSEAVKLTEKRALEQKTRINLSQQESRYPIMGDVSLAWQLVTNLLVNSMEALEEKGTIDIRTYRDEDTVIMEVEDDGPGIDPVIREKILDPFITTKEKGTGLGLAIAHSVATSMGGRLELIDKTGKGACFRARFPLVE